MQLNCCNFRMIFLRIIIGSEIHHNVYVAVEFKWDPVRYTAGFNGLITCKRYPCSLVWTSNCAWHQSPQRLDGLSRSICRRFLVQGIPSVSIHYIENCNGLIRCAFDTPAINKMEWTCFVNYYTSLYTTIADVIHPGINLCSFESKLTLKTLKKIWVELEFDVLFVCMCVPNVIFNSIWNNLIFDWLWLNGL